MKFSEGEKKKRKAEKPQQDHVKGEKKTRQQ